MSEGTSTPSRPASPVADLPQPSHAHPYRFQWDASNRRPGPGSVSGATEGPNDYFGEASQYDIYNNASLTSLQLGALPSDWSSAKHGFHAISTVVNSPHKRSAPPKAHSSLPAVPPAELPRVRRKDFDPYLSAVGPEWERFQRSIEQGREGFAQIPTTAVPSSSSFDVPDASHIPQLRPGRALPPLETVPAVFFEQNFNLGDPRTFNAVTEQPEGADAFVSDPSALSYSLPLLEKLSHHADTIEQHLVREISLRSTSFFAALSNLQDLQTESEQCLERIAKLRGMLNEVDEEGAKRGLEIVRREHRLRNLDAVKEGVKLVSGVVEMTGVAKSLVAAGQWGEALDVIDELDRLWQAGSSNEGTGDKPKAETLPPIPSREGTRSPLPTVPESPPESPKPTPADISPKPAINVPISSLKAFAALPAHLRTLTLEITSSLTSEFVNVLRLDLVELIDDSPSKERKEDPDTYLRDRLRPLLQCLARTKGVREATNSWSEVVMTEVRSTLRRRVPLSDIDGDDAKSQGSNAANELRSMPHPEFMELARAMYRSLLQCIRGLQRQHAIIVEVLQAVRSPKASVDIPALQEDLSGILSSAAELAHVRASKIIALRAEQHAALDLPSFAAVFNESWNFVVESEKICRRMIVGLRGTIVGQAKSFLQAFHQVQITNSAKLVEDEQWNAAEVAPSVQHIVDMLVDASISDPPELLLNPPALPSPRPRSPAPLSPALSPNGQPPPHPSSPLPSPTLRPVASRHPSRRSATSHSKHLHIEDRSYYAVSATLEVLVLLADYLKIMMNLEMLTTETMSRVIELLKAFNSRTCQVVLGAGAMRSAGLKNITARHLALASQSLSIVISLIPYIRETFRRHLSQKQAVMLVEFDKLKRDYQEHQNEIHQKLIAIMGDRLSVHIKSLQEVKWDVPKEGGGINDYMEIIVKDTVTLHKVLSRYLSPSVVEYVMTQVFAGINHRLSEEFTKVELPSQEAKDRLLADARYLHNKLTGLRNVGAPTAMLEIIVSEKAVARNTPPPPAQPVTTNHATQRIKGLLARSDSKRTSTLLTHLPHLPHFEKAEKVPPSPTPPVEKVAPPAPPDPEPPTAEPVADGVASADPPTGHEIEGNTEAHDAPADEPPPETPPKQEAPSPPKETPLSVSQNGDAADGHVDTGEEVQREDGGS
ncbi:Vps54-domain-containing protein [Laetiporus sulphureus 93-53]|uniref:Vps54-domain-containing protein n=1 Tax=Laetiporus sulphureus 93-53 TaxID=1314785 RepID=A0A165G255_9APHY|nr:Vps54-domain-containing protein [Laetiporus sulphureus 93-53]KZT09727.1 Vps54-domain-containing protein [Laetiporus sulphureus 93-53]